MRKYFLPLATALLLFSACSKKDTTTGTITPTPTPVPVVDTVLYKMMPFAMGAAVNINTMKSNTKYNGIVTKEYNSVTAENSMKFAALHPSENTYNWTDADYLISYAQLNNKRVHGHNLVWYTSLPSWVTSYVGDSTAWENLLKTHIQTIVAHFKGKVVSWDVVNEDFDDNGVQRNSIWKQKLGSDYIARCFKYAREADPDVLLFYNDYGHEYSSAKRISIVNMISNFKTRGIPIDGIGMQFHMTVNTSDANITAAITSAASTGLKVHLSELDIRINPSAVQGVVYTTSLGDQQALRYKYVVKTYNAIPAVQKFGITTWNVTDADSWIPGWQGAPDWPLPFSASYTRKPAYKAIIEGAL